MQPLVLNSVYYVLHFLIILHKAYETTCAFSETELVIIIAIK